MMFPFFLIIKMTLLWNVTPCSLVDSTNLSGKPSLCLQIRRSLLKTSKYR